jgi:hypothetical protein
MPEVFVAHLILPLFLSLFPDTPGLSYAVSCIVLLLLLLFLRPVSQLYR